MNLFGDHKYIGRTKLENRKIQLKLEHLIRFCSQLKRLSRTQAGHKSIQLVFIEIHILFLSDYQCVVIIKSY